MERIVRGISSSLLIGLMTVLSVGAHASAQPPLPSHAMNGMNHSTSQSSNCITVCSSATLHKEDYLNDVAENNDEPEMPFYIQFLSSPLAALENEHNQETRLTLEREPPPGGLPAYIALTVFRA